MGSNFGTMRILIAVPSSGRHVPVEWAMSLAAQNWPINSQVTFHTVKRNPEAAARGILTTADQRNELARFAVEGNAKYVLFLDDDTMAPPGTLINLFNVLERNGPPFGKVMAVTGVYTTRKNPPEPLLWREDHQGPWWNWKAGEVFPVDSCGAGCLLIRAEVLQNLPEPWFHGEHGREDLYFCNKLREGGFGLLAHGGVLCVHWDIETDTPYVLPPDSPPMKELLEREMAKEVVAAAV